MLARLSRKGVPMPSIVEPYVGAVDDARLRHALHRLHDRGRWATPIDDNHMLHIGVWSLSRYDRGERAKGVIRVGR